jgi:hypothetical protein
MESRLIRIIPDQTGRSWADRLAEGTHEAIKLNLKFSALNRFKDRLTPSVDQIKTAGSAVAGAAGSLMNLIHKSDSNQIFEIEWSRAANLKDVEGNLLSINTIYAEHPLVKGNFIKSNILHTYILKEQRSQIIRYFRSAVALKSLTIEIVSQNSGKFFKGGGWNIANAETRKETHEDHRHWFSVTYNEPCKEPTVDISTLFWMPHFDEILAVTKGASGGTIETATTLNTSFGISAKAAKVADIDSNWIAQQSFIVKAEYV